MQGDAYGMFLVHYPIALWLQYWLFDYDLPAIVKAAIGFVLTVALSWALTAALTEDSGRDAGVVTQHRHCERSEAIHPSAEKVWIASSLTLLAMTVEVKTPCRSYRPAASSRTPC